MTKSHTPTPWYIDEDILEQVRADDGLICEVEGRSADAALIVRAVNAHDALVAIADKLYQRWANTCSSASAIHTARVLDSNDARELRAALKLAKGE